MSSTSKQAGPIRCCAPVCSCSHVGVAGRHHVCLDKLHCVISGHGIHFLQDLRTWGLAGQRHVAGSCPAATFVQHSFDFRVHLPLQLADKRHSLAHLCHGHGLHVGVVAQAELGRRLLHGRPGNTGAMSGSRSGGASCASAFTRRSPLNCKQMLAWLLHAINPQTPAGPHPKVQQEG